MDRPADHDQKLQLYVLERNVQHLRVLLAAEHDLARAGVLQGLLDSAQQDLRQFKVEFDRS